MSVVQFHKSKNGTVNFMVKGGFTGQVNKDHINADKIYDLLVRADQLKIGKDKLSDRLSKLISPISQMKSQVKKGFQNKDGVITFDGIVLKNSLSKRINELTKLKDNKGVKQLIAFLCKVMENPEKESREALFDWLDVAGLIIDQDGDILGYKSVRPDFKDWYTNSMDNSVGKTVVMDRKLVDNNRNQGCGSGLHVGTLSYANVFNQEEGNKIVIVKVNPKDVVSVPKSETDKMRVCSYTVIDVMRDDARELLKQEDYISQNQDEYNDDFYDDENDDEWN